MIHRAPLPTLAAMLLFAPAPAAAQSLLVRVTSDVNGQPLHGVLISLLLRDNRATTTALTDERGLYLFVGLSPGAYELVAELIGRESVTREVTLEAGESAVAELSLSHLPISLAGLVVAADQRCRIRPEEGLAVTTVWDEARKALAAARWTQAKGLYRYRLDIYTRHLDGSGRITRQSRRTTSSFRKTPFESRSAKDLAENGFIQRSEDGRADMYFAPDPNVLLSDVFLDNHCLGLRSIEQGGSGDIGLDFRPVRSRPVPDIAGTFWLDATTGELRRVDFEYVGLPREIELKGVGGSVSFSAMPNGTWIVPEWEIRMPSVSLLRGPDGQTRALQDGLTVRGGVVSTVSDASGSVVLSAGTATIEGLVLDSASLAGLANATVKLAGTNLTMETGADGRFRFVGLLPGTYGVTFSHARIAPFGFNPPVVTVDALRDQVVAAYLTLPRESTVIAWACPEYALNAPADAGVLVGRIHDHAGRGLAGALVRVLWTDYDFSATTAEKSGSSRVGNQSGNAAASGGVRRGPGWRFRLSTSDQGVETTTDSLGMYKACLVPINTRLEVTAAWPPFTSRERETRIAEGHRFVALDLDVTTNQSSIVGRVETGGTLSPDGWVRVRGPLGGTATARYEARISPSAEFGFGGLAAGAYEVLVEAKEFAELSDTLVLEPGWSNDVTARLARAPGVGAMSITLHLDALRRRGFYARRDEAPGVFLVLDEADLSNTLASDVLGTLPGVTREARRGSFGDEVVLGLGEACRPALFIDGSLVREAGSEDPLLDDLVEPKWMAGVEIYGEGQILPQVYQGANGSCGVVSVWTR